MPRVVPSTSLAVLIVCSRSMPGKTEDNGTVGAIYKITLSKVRRRFKYDTYDMPSYSPASSMTWTILLYTYTQKKRDQREPEKDRIAFDLL